MYNFLDKIKELEKRVNELERRGLGNLNIDAIPTGTIISYPSNTIPQGFLLCDGSAVSRITYANLFAIIGTTYGAGDGSTTFNLPNLKGRVVVGRDTSQSEFDVLGETGGAKNHTLTINEIPSHTHVQNAHNHSIQGLSIYNSSGGKLIMQSDGNLVFYRNGAVWNTGQGGLQSGYMLWAIGDSANWQATTNSTPTNQNTGGGQAHNNLQPYIVLNYVIKY